MNSLVVLFILTFLLSSSITLMAQQSWTGSTSDDWHESSNWNPAGVPTANDDVEINNPSVQPIIYGGNTAVAKSVSVSTGRLTIQTNAVLTVIGSTGNGITLASNGALFNHGTVNVDDCAVEGIDVTASSLLTNDNGQILIGQNSTIQQNGIYIDIGAIDNKGSGIIKIDNIGQSAIRAHSGQITNKGFLQIGQTVGNIVRDGINLLNESSVDNNGGTIIIDRTGQSGVRGGSSFLNRNGAILSIGNNFGEIGGSGINYIWGTVTNDNSLISISDTHEDGIIVTEGIFVNIAGSILELGQTGTIGGRGFVLEKSILRNSSGTIKIDDCSAGIYIGTSSDFSNLSNGVIRIGQNTPIFLYAIHVFQSGKAKNSDCSVIHVFSDNIITDVADKFLNEGFIIENASGNSNVGTNNGIIQNLNGGTFSVGSGSDAINLAGQIWTGCIDNDWANPGNWHSHTIPTPSDDVIIPNDAANEAIIMNSTDAFAQSVVIEISSSLDILSGSSLTIAGASEDGILVDEDAKLFNEGTIKIDHTVGNGIKLALDALPITNTSSGQILIGQNGGNIGLDGIHCELNSGGVSNNGGTIKVDHTVNDGIRCDGFLTNNNAGQILIGQNGGQIGRYGIFSKEGNFNNNNSSIIKVDETNSIGMNIENEADFNNKNGSQILIGQHTGNVNGDGMKLRAAVSTNNNATIKIDNSNSIGLVIAEHKLTNKGGGEVLIGQQSGNIGGAGIVLKNGAQLFNELGFIKIDQVAGSAIRLDEAQFYNMVDGETVVGSIGNVGGNGLFAKEEGQFVNEGIIKIINTMDNGINLQESCNLTNWANIEIGQNGSIGISGIYIEEYGSLLNKVGGAILIDNTTEHALSMRGKFDNDAQFLIGSSGPVGGRGFDINITNGYWINDANGHIMIDQVSGHGIYHIVGTFDNWGKIEVGGPSGIGMDGIQFIGPAQNHACGDIEINDNFVNNSFEFINDGLFKLNTLEPHTVGNFTNNGIVEDVYGTFNGVTNNEIIVAPVAVECYEANPAFQLGNPVDLNILGVFSDENATISAGNYDLNTNTFTSTIGLGQFDLFVKIEDPDKGCTRVVKWQVDFQDNTPPLPICKTNTMIELDANGSYALQESDVFDGGTDNCGTIVYVGVSPATVSCSDVNNPVTVTVTANDGHGNEGTCETTVVVEDNILPLPTCLHPAIELGVTGTYSIQPNDVFAGGSDNCSLVSFLSMSPETVDCSDAGSTVNVTVTVSDASGNTNTCVADVSVADNAVPQPVCLNPTILLNSNGSHELTENEVFGGGTDNCGTVSFVEMSPSTLSCSDVNSIVDVIITAVDANGNQNSCMAAVTVLDNELSLASCRDITTELDSDGSVSISAAQIDNGSSDNCGIISTQLNVSNFGCADIGSNTVTLTVTDVNGNSDDCTAIVTVEDNVLPDAQCVTVPISATLDTNGEYIVNPTELDDGSSDACGVQSLSASPALLDCTNEGSNTITLTVTDVNGNTSSCTAIIEMAAFISIDQVNTFDESCAGIGDGSMTIEATTGGGQIGFSVDGGANFQFGNSFDNLTPGTYDIVVKLFGINAICEKSTTVTIGAGSQAQTWYKDMDEDGHSDGTTMIACTQPLGYYLATDLLSFDEDCNDSDASEFPGQMWYEDLDGDSFSSGVYLSACQRPTGCYTAVELSATSGDCDDSEESIYPGATEICNGIDDDCDGEIDEGASGGLVWNGNVMMTTQAAVDAWSSCYSVINGSLVIMGTNIDSLTALQGITEVTGNVTIQSTSLESLVGLDSLEAIGGMLTIYFNSVLQSLIDLDNLATIDGNLMMYYNFQLTDACPIHNLLNGGVGGSISVFLNSTGANSVTEINATCGGNNLIANPNNDQDIATPPVSFAISKKAEATGVNIYPNPAVHRATIHFNEELKSGKIRISDLTGKAVFEDVFSNGTERIELDLASWRAGTYILQIELAGRKLITKSLVVIDNR